MSTLCTSYSLPYDVQKTSQRERYMKSICLLIVACEAQTKMTNIIAFVYRYFEHTFQYQRNNKQTEWYWEQSIHLCTRSNMQNRSEQVQNVHKSIESLRTASHRIASFTSFIHSIVHPISSSCSASECAFGRAKTRTIWHHSVTESRALPTAHPTSQSAIATRRE